MKTIKDLIKLEESFGQLLEELDAMDEGEQKQKALQQANKISKMLDDITESLK